MFGCLSKNEMDDLPQFSPSKKGKVRGRKGSEGMVGKRQNKKKKIDSIDYYWMKNISKGMVVNENCVTSRNISISGTAQSRFDTNEPIEEQQELNVFYFEIIIKDDLKKKRKEERKHHDFLKHVRIGIAPTLDNIDHFSSNGKNLGEMSDASVYCGNGDIVTAGITSMNKMGALCFGDTIGCGIYLRTHKIFFTRNGTFGGIFARFNLSTARPLHPSLQLPPGLCAHLNVGESPFLFDLELSHFSPPPMGEPLVGLFSQDDGMPIPLRSCNITARLLDFTCSVSVRQEFSLPYHKGELMDLVFMLPLDYPCLTKLDIEIGGRKYTGKIESKKQPSKTKAKKPVPPVVKGQRTLSAVLLLQQVPDDTTCRITMGYISEAILQDDSHLSIEFPQWLLPTYWDTSVHDLNINPANVVSNDGLTLLLEIQQSRRILGINPPKGVDRKGDHSAVVTVTRRKMISDPITIFIKTTDLSDFVGHHQLDEKLAIHGAIISLVGRSDLPDEGLQGITLDWEPFRKHKDMEQVPATVPDLHPGTVTHVYCMLLGCRKEKRLGKPTLTTKSPNYPGTSVTLFDCTFPGLLHKFVAIQHIIGLAQVLPDPGSFTEIYNLCSSYSLIPPSHAHLASIFSSKQKRTSAAATFLFVKGGKEYVGPG